MSVLETKGDLLKQDTDAIVNTVNCVGVMGKGIALQFKRKWPGNFKAYEAACKAGEVRPGKMFVHDLGKLDAGKPEFIINFPTKDHWRGKSQLSYIEEGLQDLVRVIKELNIHSIAIPPLGCGNGGLEWQVVRPLIEEAFRTLDNQVEVRLFAPGDAPAAQTMVTRTQKPDMTVGKAVLLKLLSAYRGALDYSLGKIEVQKLCYFAQEAGEPLRLNYRKNQFGPYADNLRHVLDAMEGHYIQGVGDHDTAESQITLKPGAIEEAEALLVSSQETNDRVARVAQLIEGFETPYGMELLSTVHWVCAKNPHAQTLDDTIAAIHQWQEDKPEWNARKRTLMQNEHIRVARERLTEQGWIQ